jgi:hypothetical protein
MEEKSLIEDHSCAFGKLGVSCVFDFVEDFRK